MTPGDRKPEPDPAEVARIRRQYAVEVRRYAEASRKRAEELRKRAELAQVLGEERAGRARQLQQRVVAYEERGQRRPESSRQDVERAATDEVRKLAVELSGLLETLRIDEQGHAVSSRERRTDALESTAPLPTPRRPIEQPPASDQGGRQFSIRRCAAAVLPMLCVAVVYYLTARLGLLQELVRGQVTPYWPPTGVALVALLLLGIRIWPGIAVGALVLNATIGSSLAAVPIITVGNTLAPICAYILLRRVHFRTEIDRRRDAITLVFLAALGAMLVSATIGSFALLVTGAIAADDFWPTWSVWWTGDAMGVLVVTPFLLMIRTHLRVPRDIPWHRWVEAVCLFASTFLVTALAMTSSYGYLFLIFPFLIWAALRFQMIGAAPCTLTVSTVAIFAAAHDSGPFASHDLFADMTVLQAFNGSTALTGLVLAAIIAERNHAHEQVELAVAQLTSLVGRLDRGRKGS